MTISILTLFPQFFVPIFNSSIIGRAQKKKLVTINIVNIRDFAQDARKTVDDKPFGGGSGMILRVDILHKALQWVKYQFAQGKKINSFHERIILLDPTGSLFSQIKARKFAVLDHIILICGHYEGIDARVSQFIDEKISIGKYVLTGGELPSMVITDTIIRLIPGVLKKHEATEYETFSFYRTCEPPQYTRPRSFRGLSVPEVLLSGNHKAIQQWNRTIQKDKK